MLVGATAGQISDFATVDQVNVELTACQANGVNCQPPASATFPVTYDRMIELNFREDLVSAVGGMPDRISVDLDNHGSCPVGPMTLTLWLDGVEWVAGSARLGGAPVAMETPFNGNKSPPPLDDGVPPSGRGVDLALGAVAPGSATVTFAVFPQNGPQQTASVLGVAYVGTHPVSTPARVGNSPVSTPTAPKVACSCGTGSSERSRLPWLVLVLAAAQVKMIRRVSKLSLRGSRTPRS